MQTVKDHAVEELNAVIGEVVGKKLRDLLTDPDAGLQLRPEVVERLREDLRSRPSEGENVSAAGRARRRGLEW